MFCGREPRHEAADVPAGFAIAGQSVIIELFAGEHHRCLWCPKQAVVGPERATDETDRANYNCRPVKEMNLSASASSCLETRGKVVLQNRAEELVVSGDEDDRLSLQLGSFCKPFYGRSATAVNVAGDHGDIEFFTGLRKSDRRALLGVEIG